LATNKTKRSQKNDATLWDKLITLPQYLIPQHTLSVWMHKLTRSEVTWFKNSFIRFITAKYKVNTSEAAQTDLAFFPSFNAFFTRELRAGARPIDAGKAVITSPVDGVISQIGNVVQGRIVQAKGREYSVLELLGGDELLAKRFDQGQFATIYLSPKDYHRIHMPLTGTLRQMTYIPGKLFSVNPRTARSVPRLFARNERVVTVFDTELGPIVMVLVGAIFVGSMETVWSGMITPPYGKKIQHWDYHGEQAITIQKGEEMGRFNMGSTVVMLLPLESELFKNELEAGSVIQLGQAMVEGIVKL
jgi:phosphatidylserine decarboxylase